mmetsp:Transcript_16532/g.35917  ORF Transcript_16532/g.35917 Transcript_16532/m.35917 type:complete len:221 (+) Transcript_16532:39-701(+)
MGSLGFVGYDSVANGAGGLRRARRGRDVCDQSEFCGSNVKNGVVLGVDVRRRCGFRVVMMAESVGGLQSSEVTRRAAIRVVGGGLAAIAASVLTSEVTALATPAGQTTTTTTSASLAKGVVRGGRLASCPPDAKCVSTSATGSPDKIISPWLYVTHRPFLHPPPPPHHHLDPYQTKPTNSRILSFSSSSSLSYLSTLPSSPSLRNTACVLLASTLVLTLT